jgi:hypothetical protein
MVYNIFPIAKTSREIARQLPLINEEANQLEQAILEASRDGLLSVTVNDTLMTTPNTPEAQSYYQTWRGNIVNEVERDQMDVVIRYFRDKGYVINRVTNTSTLNTFNWIIRW